VAIKGLLVDLFLEAHKRAPTEIILDLDARSSRRTRREQAFSFVRPAGVRAMAVNDAGQGASQGTRGSNEAAPVRLTSDCCRDAALQHSTGSCR